MAIFEFGQFNIIKASKPMLWFDDGPASLADRVRRAAEYYSEKYGKRPTVCMVNPTTLNGGEGSVAGVEVRKSQTVMPDHFWLGIGKKAAKPASRKAA